ncbi:MAG: TlpA disulfide reductase family protein [bacterium]
MKRLLLVIGLLILVSCCGKKESQPEEKQVTEKQQIAEKQVAEKEQVAEKKQMAEEKQIPEKQVAEKEPSNQAKIWNGPDFTLPTIDGETLTLSELSGKVIILDFWATWCPPCRMEIPDFIQLYSQYKDKGLLIIGLSLDESPDNVRQFKEKMGINYPIVMGNQKVTEDFGGIRGIPTTFIIDREGNIETKIVGYRSKEVFEKEIDSLLKE